MWIFLFADVYVSCSSELATLPQSGESKLQMIETVERTFLRKRLDNLVELLSWH